MMRLGHVDNIDEILQKLESIYGNVLVTEDILVKFYNAKQKDTDNCANCSIRLEALLNRAITNGQVYSAIEAKEMFHTVTWAERRNLKLA